MKASSLHVDQYIGKLCTKNHVHVCFAKHLELIGGYLEYDLNFKTALFTGPEHLTNITHKQDNRNQQKYGTV